MIILNLFSLMVFSSNTTHVKDYIQGKFPSIFQFYLSSLGELDQYEMEFIDLLEELPKEEQEYYAKEVYANGFSYDLLQAIKEGKKTAPSKGAGLSDDRISKSDEQGNLVSGSKDLKVESLRFQGEMKLYYCQSCLEEKVNEKGEVVNKGYEKHFEGFNILTRDERNYIKLVASDNGSIGNHNDCEVIVRGEKWLGLENESGTALVNKINQEKFDFDPANLFTEKTMNFPQDGYQYEFADEGQEFRLYLARNITEAFQAVPWQNLSVEIKNKKTNKTFTYQFEKGIFPRSYTWSNGVANYGQCIWWTAKRWVEEVDSQNLFPFYPSSPQMASIKSIDQGYRPEQYDILIDYIPGGQPGHYAFVEKVEEDKIEEDLVYISQFNFIPPGEVYNSISRSWSSDDPKSLYYSLYRNSRDEFYFKYYYRLAEPTVFKESKSNAIAIIMDRSGSMSGEKLAKEIQATEGFIASLNIDDYSCLVTFADSANTEVELLQATSENKRKLYAAAGTVGAGGNTNIGAGLTHGLHQLTGVSESASKAALLMSDGMHNTGELWPAVEQYEERGWPVHTVAYGADADQQTLEAIARNTGGIFFPGGIYDITQIYQRISAHTHNQSVLFAYNDTISQGKKLDYQIPIDPDITSATFFVDWQGSVVDLHLQTPEEEIISPDNFHTFPGVDYQTGDTFCFYQVDKPIPGDWQATLYGKEIDRESEQVNLTVSGSSPLLANIFGLPPSYQKGEAIQIKVKVLGLFGSEPEILRDVKVTAQIKKPSPNLKKMLQKGVIDLGQFFQYALTNKKKLTLHDDGNHGDWRADDGIFGAVYRDTDENGPYLITVKCEAQKPDGEKIVRILRESVQVGPFEDRNVTLADFLGF